MCGKKQNEQKADLNKSDLNEDLRATVEMQAPVQVKPESLRDRQTEVLSQQVIQEKLDQIRESIPEQEAPKKSVEKDRGGSFDAKRRFSETMWFMQGLDSDQLVEDSDEDVASDNLQDRYEKKSDLSDGIRGQFTLGDGVTAGTKTQKDLKDS
jgi:hypothetical protein